MGEARDGDGTHGAGQPAVLLVEDEFLIALDLEEMLCRHGWRVIGPAVNVDEALALLEREHPAAAVLDIDLRGERSTPVAEALRARAIPFLVASAFTARTADMEAFDGAPRVPKPVSEAALLRTLDRIGGAPNR